MRWINNCSPPLLCTASTGEETRFPPLPRLILKPNSLDSRFWVSGLLRGFYTPTRCLNSSRQRQLGWLWSHVLVASNWMHARTKKKLIKVTQPFTRTHSEPETAKINLSDPLIPVTPCKTIRSFCLCSLSVTCLLSVLSFYTASHHHNPKFYNAILFLHFFPPWSVNLGQH